jgi:DnaJ-class molecular chaperone
MFTDNNKEFYTILEIDENSDLDTIKAAYKKLSFKWHPDKNINNKEESENKFKNISEAYQVLSNPHKKKMYDLGVDSSIFPENYESMFSQSQEFVSNIFKFDHAEEYDISIDITQIINLEEAYFGTEKKIQYKLNKMCKSCDGIGLHNTNNVSNCNICNGIGKMKNFNVVFPGIVNSISKICTKCNGIGKISEDNLCCMNCKGKKMIYTSDTFVLKIPAGIFNNYIFIIDGRGHFSPIKEGSGSLNIKIEILEDNKYKRVGDHLVLEKDILLSDALCCKEFYIDHISKRKIIYNTNEIIKPNCFSVINNLGMPILDNIGKFGHLIIKYNVLFPNYLSDKRKMYLKKLLPISDDNNIMNIKTKDKNIYNSISLNENQNKKLYEKIYLQNNQRGKKFPNAPVECAQM